MADLIDRQAALDAVEAYFGDLPIAGHYDMLQLIKELPPAQPERKTGRWKGEGMGDYRCSWCGEVSHQQTNFCPNCGADMRTPTQVNMDEADDVMMGGNDETD